MGWDGIKHLKYDYGNKTDNKVLTYLCSSPDNNLVQPVEKDFLAVSGIGRGAGWSEAKEIFTSISMIKHGGNKSNMTTTINKHIPACLLLVCL